MATGTPKKTSANVAPPERKVTFVDEGGFLRANYVWRTYRFFLAEGTLFDVVAVRDDSDLREAVLQHTKSAQIVGVVRMPEEPPAPHQYRAPLESSVEMPGTIAPPTKKVRRRA